MGDYHDHYLKKMYCYQLTFTKSLLTRLKYHGLDPCHYFSFPGLSWQAMLKITDIKLEKISDIDKYVFIEKGLREEFLTLLKDMLKQITNI